MAKANLLASQSIQVPVATADLRTLTPESVIFVKSHPLNWRNIAISIVEEFVIRQGQSSRLGRLRQPFAQVGT
jgi:hypothetical protein